MEWIIDVHEPQSMIDRFENARVDRLDIGDYVYGDVGFERKYKDFLNISDVITKAMELKQTYPYAYLLVQGNLNDFVALASRIFKKNMYAPIMGMVASLSVRGIPPIFCSNEQMLYDVMKRIAYKHYDGKNREVDIRTIKIRATDDDWAINILVGLPKIGRKKAIKLLEKFGSVYNVMNASVNELASVSGISYDMAEHIYRVIHKEYGGDD